MTPDHNEKLQGHEKARFPLLLLLGVALAVVVIVVAMVALDSEYGIPIALLTLICVIAAVGFRLIAGSNRTDADSSDNVPKQPARSERPLGDTPEAHDEINPHDVPLDNPGRPEVEREARTVEGTTTGTRDGRSVAG